MFNDRQRITIVSETHTTTMKYPMLNIACKRHDCLGPVNEATALAKPSIAEYESHDRTIFFPFQQLLSSVISV